MVVHSLISSAHPTCFARQIRGRSTSLPTVDIYIGLEKKLELDELARARSSSARLGPARRSERARAEPVFLAREKSEPARELARGSIQQQFVT
jgi:hypothetical protein